MGKRMVSFSKSRQEGILAETDLMMFDGYTDFADHVEALPYGPEAGRVGPHVEAGEDDFHGRSWRDMTKALRTGAPEWVHHADKYLAGMEELLDWQSTKWKSRNDVAGGRLNVGRYLADLPDCARRRVRVEDDTALLNVIVAINAASAISPEDLMKRGAAILAFVRLMSAGRPVNLYASAVSLYGSVNSGFAFKLETAPLDLARAAFVLVDASMARRASFAVRCAMPRSGGAYDPFVAIADTGPQGGAIFAKALGCKPEDTLYLKRFDRSDLIASDPRNWILDNATKYGRVLQAEG